MEDMIKMTFKELFNMLISITRISNASTPCPPLSLSKKDLSDMYHKMKQNGSYEGTWNDFQHMMKDRNKE